MQKVRGSSPRRSTIPLNGELAQLIALATYGSVWLAGDGAEPPPDLEQTNSTFQFVGGVEFAGPDGGSPLKATGVWFRSLRVAGLRRLWLSIDHPPPARPRWPHLEPHMEVAFANGGHWRIVATGSGKAAAWTATWTVHDIKAADRRIWKVRYDARTPEAPPTDVPEVDLAQAALERTIQHARSFAERTEALSMWTDWFDRALSGGATPTFPDMVPPSFPEPARRLIAVASHAWVFGGMGSWNDAGSTDPALSAEHAEISRVLFGALLTALVAAVNCPLADQSPKMARSWPR